MTRYVGNHLRLAIVTDVDHEGGIMKTQWLDNNAEPGQDVPIPHPAPGRGDGIYHGIRPGALVALAVAAYERYIPVAVIPIRGFYIESLSDVPELHFDDVGFPPLRGGEVCVQGVTGSKLFLDDAGNISLRNAFLEGPLIGGDYDNSHRCSIVRLPPVEYSVSEAGLMVLGTIRRDIRADENEFDTALADPMFDLEYEHSLEEVGRDPSKSLASSTLTSGGKRSQIDQFRNPGFVEHRRILNEFGTSWLVDAQGEEEALLTGNKNRIPVRDPEERRERRNNVLSLSLAYPNELMETIEGTLADLFGNLLDINRHVLAHPSDKDAIKWLRTALENAQHTIAYHKEINTRKGWAYRTGGLDNLQQGPDPKLQASSANNARDRSRWSIDVDKEGLTKINIPATSETGTVPVLARYETSSSVVVDDKGNAKKEGRAAGAVKALFRSAPEKGKERRDVFLDQFGPGGIQVVDDDGKGSKGEPVPKNRLAGEKTSNVESTSQDTLPSTVEAGTAFHDITKTALALLTSSINKKSSDAEQKTPPTAAKDEPAIHDKVNRVIPKNVGNISRDAAGRPKDAPNAGGRSVHLNLDGSLEMSVGANTVDRVSWVVDTAGALVARLGRDRLGRSAIIHMDGTLALEVGGFDFIGQNSQDTTDTRFVGGGKPRAGETGGLPKDASIFRSGKVVIRVRSANAEGTGPNEGFDQLVIIDEGGVSIESAGRMNFRSKGNMLLKSDAVITLDARAIQLYPDIQKFVLKTGRKIP